MKVAFIVAFIVLTVQILKRVTHVGIFLHMFLVDYSFLSKGAFNERTVMV